MKSQKVHYLDIEGLAINGLLRKADLIDCEIKPKIRRSKIIVETFDGKIFETECIDYERIVRIWIVIKHYEKWGRDIVIKGLEEKPVKEEDLEKS
ncbi:MAG: hypothetical protein GU359_04105 [Desulfurococcales archaeon]|jgi:hypothetical protein|nr:hypothetical protein [Desulfurococcales archaeon]